MNDSGFDGSALLAAQTAFLDGICAEAAPGPVPGMRGRMEIYRGPYWARMSECVAEDFPRARARMGDAEFARAVRAFVASGFGGVRYATLARIGERFPAFLGSGEPAWRAATGRATVDWLWIEASRGEQPEFTAARQLATLLPERLADVRLRLNPGLRWARLPGERGVWLAWPAPDDRVRLRRVSASRFRMLQRAARGWSVGRIAQASRDPARLRRQFEEAVAWGLVAGILG